MAESHDFVMHFVTCRLDWLLVLACKEEKVIGEFDVHSHHWKRQNRGQEGEHKVGEFDWDFFWVDQKRWKSLIQPIIKFLVLFGQVVVEKHLGLHNPEPSKHEHEPLHAHENFHFGLVSELEVAQVECVFDQVLDHHRNQQNNDVKRQIRVDYLL